MARPLSKQLGIVEPWHYWFATAEDVAWPVEHPNEGRPFPEVRWDYIAAAADRLARAHAAVTPAALDEDGVAWIEPSSDVDELTRMESVVVASLWRKGEDIVADPWSDAVRNGRHRSYGIWSVSPHVVLPIRSNLLEDVADLPNRPPECAIELHQTAREQSPRVPAAVANRSTAFMTALQAFTS